MAESKVVQSPLYSAMNNIVKINSSAATMKGTQRTYNDFQSFMQRELIQIKSIELPEKYKIQKLGSLNVGNVFNKPANLLSGLVNGALDIGSFFGNFLGKKGKGAGKGGKTPPIKDPGANPKIGGGKLKLGGFKALGIANALFAGLDFATGLSEGESVGKSAAGTGGALAGSLLGGAIGQTLIPVPGLGFVVGSMAGNFLGGYLADRGYETATGGDKTVEQKTKERLKQQEKIQRERARGTSTTSFTSVLDKFENVVSKFERSAVIGGITTYAEEEQTATEQIQEKVAANEASQSPLGPEIAMEGEGTFLQGSTGRSTGPHFHIGPNENYGKPEGRKDARDAALKVSKALLSKKIPFMYSNLKQWVRPSQKLSDSELMDLITKEQRAHETRSMGSSFGGIDIAAPYGTKLPFPVSDVRDRGDGFGITGNLVGTKGFVAHGAVGSKSTPKEKIKQIAPPPIAEGVAPTIATDQKVGQPTSKGDLSKMSTDQLKGMLDPTMTGASNPAVFKASQEARTKGQESGLTGETLEREVMIASIKAKESMQVQAIPQQQVTPRQIEQYPSYNQPTAQVQSVIMPILMGGGSPQRMKASPQSNGVSFNQGGNQSPSQVPQGKLVNSLLTTILLTNLSSS